MATAKLTLIGMYQWAKLNNDDLFTNLTVPTGVDKDILVDTILMNGAEFEVLYGDFEFMKFLIGKWSDKWQRTMEKWAEALAIEYNPLENYDRMEEWDDNRKSTTMNADKESDNTFNTASSTSSGTGSNEDKKAAYDSSTYQNYQKSDTTSSGNNTSTGIEGRTNQRNGISDQTEESTRKGRTHGNIGVTTSQQMLQAQLDISRFNLYDEISNLFLTELVVYTY